MLINMEGQNIDEIILTSKNLSFRKFYDDYYEAFGLIITLFLMDLESKFNYFEKNDRLDEEGFFFNTRKNIKKTIELTSRQQLRATKELEKLGILYIKKKGIPSKNYYRIDQIKLFEVIKKRLIDTKKENDVITSDDNLSRLVITNCNANKNKDNKNKINKSLSKDKDKVPDGTSCIPSKDIYPIKLNRRKAFIPKEVIPKNIPTDVEEILDYWTEMKLQKIPREGTKAYSKSIQKVKGLLSGKLFGKKYSVNTIKEVICSFSFAALDPQFEPASITYKKKLSKTNISDFILNEFNKNGNGSYFKQYLKDPPKTLKEFTPTDDKYPAISKQIKEVYKDKILGKANTKFTADDENKFRMASNKMIDFFKDNEDKLELRLNNADKIELLFDSILKTVDENKVTITPGWLCSDTTINKRLPSYCFKQSIFQSSQKWSMYDKKDDREVLTIDEGEDE